MRFVGAEIPSTRYICFYPMDRRRGEHKNWYQKFMADRAGRGRAAAPSAADTPETSAGYYRFDRVRYLPGDGLTFFG